MATVEDRFWSKVDKSGDCWLWTGGQFGSGYGEFYLRGKNVYAHRVAYALSYGEIEVGLQIDHRCHDDRCPGRKCSHRLCCNPAHMSAGTAADNNAPGRRRLDGPQFQRRTECRRGHMFTEENTYEYRGTRTCKRCKLERQRHARAIAR